MPGKKYWDNYINVAKMQRNGKTFRPVTRILDKVHILDKNRGACELFF